MDMAEEKYNVKLRRLNGTRDENFQLWRLRMKAVLRGKNISKALTTTMSIQNHGYSFDSDNLCFL